MPSGEFLASSNSLWTVPTKYKSFCARLGPRVKRRFQLHYTENNVNKTIRFIFGGFGRAPGTITERYIMTYFYNQVCDTEDKTELSDSLQRWHCQTEARKNLPEKDPYIEEKKNPAGNLGGNHGPSSK